MPEKCELLEKCRFLIIIMNMHEYLKEHGLECIVNRWKHQRHARGKCSVSKQATLPQKIWHPQEKCFDTNSN